MSNANTRDAERKADDAIDKAANAAHSAAGDVRKGVDDFKDKAGPKVKEAETFLTSPTAIGFYQGVIVGAALVLGYAKINGGLRI